MCYVHSTFVIQLAEFSAAPLLMMWLKNCFNILVILTITAAKISSENNYQKFSWNKISDDNNKEAIKNKVVANFHKFLNSKTEFKNSKTATNWEFLQKKRIDDIATLFNSSFVPYKDYFNFSRITGRYCILVSVQTIQISNKLERA